MEPVTFETLTEATEAYNARVSALNSDLAAAQELAQQAEARANEAQSAAQVALDERNAAQARNEELTASVGELTGQIATITGERDAAQTELLDAKLDLERISQLAQVKGINISEALPAAAASTPDSKTLTRAEFDKLAHSERNEFFRTGGKIEA